MDYKRMMVALGSMFPLVTGASILLLTGFMPLRISNEKALFLGFGLVITGWAMALWASPFGRHKEEQ